MGNRQRRPNRGPLPQLALFPRVRRQPDTPGPQPLTNQHAGEGRNKRQTLGDPTATFSARKGTFWPGAALSKGGVKAGPQSHMINHSVDTQLPGTSDRRLRNSEMRGLAKRGPFHSRPTPSRSPWSSQSCPGYRDSSLGTVTATLGNTTCAGFTAPSHQHYKWENELGGVAQPASPSPE